MWNLKNDINKENRQTDDTEIRPRVVSWERCCGPGGRGKGLRSTNWQLQNSRADAKGSMGNIVSNIVMLFS